MTTSYWDKTYNLGRDYTLISSAEIDRFLKHIDPSLPKRMLDIGCGTGQLTRELFHRGYITIGVDSSASAVKIAQSLTHVSSKKMTYLHIDAEKSDVIDSFTQFSLIVCKLTYAFIKEKPEFIDSVKKWLSPGGTFVVITPMLDDVPDNKTEIAVSTGDMDILRKNFVTLEYFKQKPGAYPLTYFVGKDNLE